MKDNLNQTKTRTRAFIKKICTWVLARRHNNINKIASAEQLRNALVVFAILLLCVGFYIYSSREEEGAPAATEGGFESTFGPSFNKNNDEALIEKQQHELNHLKELVDANSKKQESSLNEALKEKEAIQKTFLSEMKTKVERLEAENEKMNEQLQVALTFKARDSFDVKDSHDTANASKESQRDTSGAHNFIDHSFFESRGMETVRFNARKKERSIRTPDNYAWAGTFVEGYLLTGILGDAGINGSKNMGTALIRLTSNGVMPNDKHSHLKGCMALVSTYGDLSGSSVVLHLETLSCAGGVVNFEQKVYGSVFDLDAMQDVRGTSVLKTKPLLSYTAAAGALVGIGTGLQNWGSAQSINSNGSIMTFSPSNMVRTAAGAAMATPATKLADYIMKIAEIYHPLVVARAGRRVSVLFTKGFWIDKEHQVFESGKSIDDNESQKTPNVVTAFSHVADSGETLARSLNLGEHSGATNTIADARDFSSKASQSSDLFSSIQPRGAP